MERRVLRQTVVLRGDVATAQSLEVTPAPKDGSLSVVTSLKAKQGQQIKSGDLLLEVGGRPLFVLAGAKPAYRDLRPGYEGSDVEQLQKSLRALGFGPVKADGYFGAGTKRAVEKFYESIGYAVIPTGPDDAKLLATAQRQITAAQRAFQDATDPVAKKRAREDLKAAKADYNDLQEATGPTVPVSEYAFLPGFPSRIESVNASVGAEVKSPLVKLSSGRLLVNALLSPANAGAVKPGMAVDIKSEALGIEATGRVRSIGDLEIDQDSGISGHEMVVVPDKSLNTKLAGQNVRLSITAAATPGPVIVIPVSAIFANADGTTRVTRINADRRKEAIVVTPGLEGDGYVEVEGDLDAGDTVVIGVASQ